MELMNDQQQRMFNEFRHTPKRYPVESKLSDEKLLKRVNEIIEDMNKPMVIVKLGMTPLVIEKEIVLFLSDKPRLTHLYFVLSFLEHTGIILDLDQKEIAKYAGYSEDTYYSIRNKLVQVGLIRIEYQGRRCITKLNAVYPLKELAEKPYNKSNPAKFLKDLITKVKLITPDVIKKEEEKQVQAAFAGVVEEKALEIVKKKAEAQKKQEQKFSNEDYEIVLTAFKKHKGVGLIGPEVVRAKHAIKQMFLAQRTPKQIIDCMKFFAEHREDEGYEWLRNWTLETVMKKMPEFLGGQLKAARLGDDIEKM